MRLSNAQLKARLNIAALAVLLVGLASALLIYTLSEESAPDAVGYVIVDGLKYPIEPGQSKRYVRDLERSGGKANVVFDEFGRWLAGLWQGKQLAVTIAWLSIAISAILFLLGRAIPSQRADKPLDV